MSQTITITLPDRLFEPIQRMAQATDQPVEAILLTALQTSLPSLDGLPDSQTQALVALEALDNVGLQQVLLEMVPAEEQRALDTLLRRNQAGDLSEAERAQLALLQDKADRVMLCKARAAVLLRFRGQRIPTLAELRQMTIDKR